MAADVFGQRVQHQIGAERERTLEHRTRKYCPPGPGTASSLPRADLGGDLAHERKIHQAVGRVGGRLRHDEADLAAALRARALARSAASLTAARSYLRRTSVLTPKAGNVLWISVSVPP